MPFGLAPSCWRLPPSWKFVSCATGLGRDDALVDADDAMFGRKWGEIRAPPLLAEHPARFASHRLYPYHAPSSFHAFLTTGKGLVARPRYAAVINGGADDKHQYVNEGAHQIMPRTQR